MTYEYRTQGFAGRGGRKSDWLFVGVIALVLLALLGVSLAVVGYVIYFLWTFRINAPF